MLQTTRLGKSNLHARPHFARPRLCPVCGEAKQPAEFRQTNRNPRLSVICYDCRKRDPRCEAKFYGTKFRRVDSAFRKRFWAVKRLLEARLSKKEVNKIQTQLKNQAVNFLKLPERVAAVVGKTYAVRGDDYKLSDDEALTRIRDLLDELDPTLIARNKEKRLSKTS